MRRTSLALRRALPWLAVAQTLAAVALGAPKAEVLIAGEITPSFERKLGAEAASVGLVLLRTEGRDPLEVARARAAVAVVRLSGAASAEISITAPGREPEHESMSSGTSSPELFAVRIVEQLRARLVELDVLPRTASETAPSDAPPAPAPSPPSSAAVPENPPEAVPAAPRAGESPIVDDASRPGTALGRRFLWIETGLGASAASGGVPGALHAMVGLSYAPERFSVTAFGLLPLSESTVKEIEGRAEVSASLIGGHLDFVFTDPDGALGGNIGLGGGALVLAMTGEAVSPFSGRSETVTVGALFVDAGVRYRAADWLGVRGSTFVGSTAPRPVLDFAGREVATWGRAFGVLVASLEFGAPFLAERAP